MHRVCPRLSDHGQHDLSGHFQGQLGRDADRAWDTNYFGGGLWWRQSDRQSKNACIQGPATIAACYLYNISGDTNYLNKAQAIYAWNRKYLFNTNSGAISDNINTNGTVDTVALTYNQGTFIGSANLLYRATGLPYYYQDAILAGKRTQNNMTTAGVLPEWGSNSDLSGFNGIFIRWMGRFAKEQNLWAAFGPWLGTNANAAWSIRNTNNLAWQKWRTQTPDVSSEVANWGCSAAVIALQVADPSPSDPLQITPTVGFTAVTEARRLPAANSTVLTLTNTGAAALNWSLINTSAWLTVSASSGTLNTAAATDITVNLVPSVATNLPAGRYFANVALTNVTTGIIAQRIFTLVIAVGDAPILTTGQNAKILAPNTATSGTPEATSFGPSEQLHILPSGLGQQHARPAARWSFHQSMGQENGLPIQTLRQQQHVGARLHLSEFRHVDPDHTGGLQVADHSRVLGEWKRPGVCSCSTSPTAPQVRRSASTRKIGSARPPTSPFKRLAG
ncbi:MAG: glycoside hydrolase family 76 protein [Verrucomicrobiota bacterium]